MKHYIVFYEDRMFMAFAKDPKTAIYTIINNFELDRNDFKLFKSRGREFSVACLRVVHYQNMEIALNLGQKKLNRFYKRP